MSKIRVYEIARELGVKNRELLDRIASLGIQVRNHMSSLEPAEAEKVKRSVQRETSERTVETRIRPTVVRRRVRKRDDEEDGEGFDELEAAPPPPRAAAVVRRVPAPRPDAPEVEAAPELEIPRPPKPPAIEVAPRVEPEPEPPPRVEPKPEPPPRVEPKPEPAAMAAMAEPRPEPPPRSAPRPAPRMEPRPEPAPRSEPRPEPAPMEASGGFERPMDDDGPQISHHRGSQPPPASIRLGHANLPPGVVSRGNATAPAAPRLSEAARNRIVSQHATGTGGGFATAQGGPRRRQLSSRDIGPRGRKVGGRGRRRITPGKKGLKTEITVPSAQKRIIKIEDNVGLQMLASRMSLKATQLLMKLVQLGMTNITINSTLDTDTATLIAGEFGYQVENVAKSDDELVAEARGEFDEAELDYVPRAPIVTVMGHVDHGKTSLLDKIRDANIAAREAGGITQHIGAYRVKTERGDVVFLDTPGHEAFTAMRARGAQATDVVILVVAADDGVMPQTREAINHAKAAEVPIIVAVNKIDKPDAKPDQIRNELSGLGLQPEEWGGDTLFVNVSAHTGEGVAELVESVSLQSEMLELTANPKIPAEGTVLEAYLDKGRGPVAHVLVQNGTLRQGAIVLAGHAVGKVRALTDQHRKRLKVAGPATPVEVLGLSDVPAAGDAFFEVASLRDAEAIADGRKKAEEAKRKASTRTRLEDVHRRMREGQIQELKLVVKSDVHGSTEALVKALNDLSTEKVRVHVIHTGVGGITENDVMLASASDAIIIGFNVRPAGKAGATAKSEGVDVRSYRVIYEAVDEVKLAMAGLLDPEYREKDLGKAEVRQTFSIPKIGTIAGCLVTEGKIIRAGRVRLVRDGVQVWDGQLGSLRRFKDDVREVASGYECGIGLEGFNDLKERDVIECYELEEIAATL